MTISSTETTHLLSVLKRRFEENMQRHPGMLWEDILPKLNTTHLLSLFQMENTGGEPDVIDWDGNDEIVFIDCSIESPQGRRSVCYDSEALDARKEHKPAHSAIEWAQEMGVELLNEDFYKRLQKLGAFDLKTSSWLQTDTEIRKLGGAIFGDRRYGRVFIYHNGAQSYYAARGFRTCLKL